MEPVTHFLAGLTLARAGANRLAPAATAAIVLGSLLPDIDFVFTYAARPTFLHFEQGWAHSFAGAGVLGILGALPIWWRARRTKAQSPHLGLKLFLAVYVGLLGHLLLDWTTPFGVRFFWPFGTWHALDWFARVDLWLLAALLLGLAVPMLFRLISEEIGARTSPRGAQRGAWAALVLLLVFCAVRAYLHGEALALLDGQTYRGRMPLRVAAFPTAVNPFHWRGIAETGVTLELVEANLAGPDRGVRIEFSHYKPDPSPALEAAQTARVAQAFLGFARFPLAEVNPTPDGQRVVLRDLRFAQAAAGRRHPVAWIELDGDRQVRGEGFSLREKD